MNKPILFLVISFFYFPIYGQSTLKTIQNDCITSFAGEESFTEPYNLTNIAIEFGIEEPCQVTIKVKESSVEKSRDQREIRYTFHANDIDLDREWVLTDGVFAFPIVEVDKLAIQIFQNDTLAKEPIHDIVEMAASDDNFKLVDAIEALAEYCTEH